MVRSLDTMIMDVGERSSVICWNARALHQLVPLPERTCAAASGTEAKASSYLSWNWGQTAESLHCTGNGWGVSDLFNLHEISDLSSGVDLAISIQSQTGLEPRTMPLAHVGRLND